MKNLILLFLISISVIAYSSDGKIMNNESDWKLKLCYGKEKTPYTHYTVLADGECGEMIDGFTCPKGNAIMAVKVWATDINEPTQMVKSIGSQIGFIVDGEVQIYETEPEEPPKENPYGYDIKFTPYD